jgi:hypothetical protein
MLIQLYNTLKNIFSIAIDVITGNSVTRTPLIHFSDPRGVAAYLQTMAKYTGDPGYGIVDFSTNPQVFMSAMLAGAMVGKDAAFANMHIDCDDYAAFAFAACYNIPGVAGKIYTLLDSGLVGSHVIYVGYYKSQFFGIDTNGYRNLPDAEDKTICDTWSRVYAKVPGFPGYNYISATPTPFPFPLPM